MPAIATIDKKYNIYYYKNIEYHTYRFCEQMSQDYVRHFILLMYRKQLNKFNRKPVRRAPFAQNINVSRFINKSVITEKTDSFVPVHQFQDFNIDARLKANIFSKGFIAPTPIQDKIIPHVLQGSDVVGVANTGTGKTGAFLIPLMQKAMVNPREKILIVVPTRELALQINQEFKSFSRRTNIYSICCVGGVSVSKQIFELKNYNNNFIISTPGRLKDLVQRKVINLSAFSTIVLDEADRMLDMGFIKDMRFIMNLMPKKRHTLCFSATIVKEVTILINEFLSNPVTISVKSGDTPKNIYQDIVRVSNGGKIDTLHNLLNQREFHKVLMFGRTKHGVEKLSKDLTRRGFKADSIHGNKNHSKRQRVLGLFRNDGIKILVATDVAARGLDIPNVSHVINYDIPATYEDYVHRIGRTGRSNKRGIALTFVS